ncbi:TPA: restriction endonuclease subunit S [Vibrio parahaemolyticus]|nr:restriction endonuclease subunit S [Vibrio parahaemolyticus]
MVPNGWSKQQISDICTLQNGNSFKPHQWDTKGLPIIRIQNLNGSENFNYYSGEVNEKWLVETGQLLFSWAGTKGVSFGPFIWKKERGVLNQHIYKVYAQDQVDQDWLYESLRWVTNKIEAQAHGFKATLLHVQKKDIDNQPILVPPLPEQRRIAQILSTWDRGIATTEKLIDASKQQKKALMQQLLTGKKRLIDPETGKVFEGEWERHSLSDLVYVDRKSLGKKTPDNFKFKYISLSNVDFGVISKELEVHEFSAAPSRARRVLQDGDILMSTVRPNLKGFAKVTSCYADCIASTGFAVLTPKKKVSGDYIYQYIFSAHVTGQIDSLVVGSNYPAINSSDVSGLKVYCPAFEEQQKIASVLTAADKEIELLEAKLAHLKQEKKALMQQLLTGKRRVMVADTEAA